MNKKEKKLSKKLKNKLHKNKTNKKIIQLKNNLNTENIISLKKLRIYLILILILLFLLIVRIFYLQIIEGKQLAETATKQQTTSEIISGNRGNIYDSTGSSLAISETVDTVTVNPSKLSSKKLKDKDVMKQALAQEFSEIFSLDYNETFEKLNSTSSQTIAKKVEEDKINLLKSWMHENEITNGVNIYEDNKRYYPYGTLASHILGFCGDDNQGLSGIEFSYDEILTGTSRKNYNLN